MAETRDRRESRKDEGPVPNPVREAQMLGQSIWYDNLRRGMLTSGELAELVDDGLGGVTSNPSIFEKAIAGSVDYDEALKALVEQGVGDAKAIYERLAIEDIQRAADVLRPVHARTRGGDGYVSLEVSPHLARDTEGTIAEARRLAQAVGRANVMIKVPGTPEGIAAVAQLTGDGISINVTLLFALDAYLAAADAFLTGLERFTAGGGDARKVASVASFFLSRIDTVIDDKIGAMLDATRDDTQRARLKSLLGQVAIANARIAYAEYQKLIAERRWTALARTGARPQRLLWASTGTKNPTYPKMMYVEELIGPDTVNTVPAETFREFRAHGHARSTLTGSVDRARQAMAMLEEVGISIKKVSDALLDQGLVMFSASFDKLLAAIARKRQALLGGTLIRQTHTVKDAEPVTAAIEDWRARGKVRRLWNRDSSLWTGKDEDRWLGWLDVVCGQCEHMEPLARMTDDVRQSGVRHLVLLGMGGSSLCPWVLEQTFGTVKGFPKLLVLDSIVPAQIRAVERRLDLRKTLFIVSSKSGGTTEPNALMHYFMHRVRESGISEPVGTRFVAITDPGTALHDTAKRERFRHICPGVPSIGGRYSALSNFGLVPAALMGLDVRSFVDRAEIMVHACASSVPPEANPGVTLGLILGTLARQGRDKVTIVTSPSIRALGAWLEQLLAESTGKEGQGLVPVDDERLGPPEVYGADRLFVYIREESSASAEQDAAVDVLERAGHPVVRMAMENPMDLGQSFFRWEIATAVAGSVLGINAFDQPDVEASKIATKRFLEADEQTRARPPEPTVPDEKNLRILLDRLRPGDYFAVNAYLEMNDDNQQHLQAIRHAVRDRKRVATTLGYGPRFLHSTGQLHKGGPNTGVFLQITAEDAEDLLIPGKEYSFGTLKRAQASGDYEVLAHRGRRLLPVHLGPDVRSGLRELGRAVEGACS
ncbi:MAG: bifunctional transaldolase/phosoglucose isomerase [Acidobacteria bacterium]|nr:bifunctional transaldolase/phosoglucose isomerase [Acidobacteriota bacterium]